MPKPLEPVRLAMYCTGCMPGYHLPCFVGITQGIFRRHGLDVEIVDPEPGPDNILAVDAGRYDLCLTSVAHFLNAKRVEPAIEPRFVFMVARRTHMAAFAVADRIAATGRPIARHADLDGATVLGTGDSAFVREYVTLLDQIGCSPGAIVETPYEEVMSALVRGAGDVAPDFLNLMPKFAAAAGTAAHIVALPFYQAGVDVYGSGLVAGLELRTERPRVLQAAVDALREALMATREEPDLGLEALTERVPGVDRGQALADWRAGEPLIFGDEDHELGSMNAGTWQRTLDYFAGAYGDAGDIDLDGLCDTSFLTRAGPATVRT
ncbi:MAG TPA: ABC transporter substrate-binding protein [Solirubrobacteraceae bacterium]|nr:ABC transporter substrate-binding protein [Solirubrobacteraceae bacterium]